MRKLLGLVVLVGVIAVFSIPQSRAVAIGYGKISIGSVMAMVGMAQVMAENDLEACQGEDEAQRRECLKRHESPLDMLSPELDTAGQQDKLYKAMEQ